MVNFSDAKIGEGKRRHFTLQFMMGGIQVLLENIVLKSFKGRILNNINAVGNSKVFPTAFYLNFLTLLTQ